MATKKKPDRNDAAPPTPPPPAPPSGPSGDTVDVTLATLEETPSRLLDLLRGIGTRPEIRLALGAFGYTHAEHERGWNLLHACSGYHPAAAMPTVDRKVTGAINTLDASDESTRTIIDLSLAHRAPKARAVLLNGLETGRGATAVVFFATLLDRFKNLTKGTLDGLTAEEAQAADAILVDRGYDAAWRERHATLVEEAQGYSTPEAPDETKREIYLGHLRAARAFYEEWAGIARATIKRKDYLIALGLASRKTPKKPNKEG